MLGDIMTRLLQCTLCGAALGDDMELHWLPIVSHAQFRVLIVTYKTSGNTMLKLNGFESIQCVDGRRPENLLSAALSFLMEEIPDINITLTFLSFEDVQDLAHSCQSSTHKQGMETVTFPPVSF